MAKKWKFFPKKIGKFLGWIFFREVPSAKNPKHKILFQNPNLKKSF
jgi:hypothetical protein